jgi:polysaccharide export outer membrane protein
VSRAPDLSVTVPVRPDGRITIPLVEDIDAAGKTATELAREIELKLRPYVQQPSVSIVVAEFADYSQYTVRVVGEAMSPTSVAYRPGLTLLDVMTAAQGLTEFAAGNSAKLVRHAETNEIVYSLRLDDLMRDGDVDANVPVLPGDVIVIPPSLL